MKLTTEQIKIYEEQGFLFIPECFSREEISIICDQIPNVMDDEAVGRVLEDVLAIFVFCSCLSFCVFCFYDH